jgi:hypothetical protein
VPEPLVRSETPDREKKLPMAKKKPTGPMRVELHGLDIYDPTTGAVRSSSTDDMACWFVDSDYNGESFFVRHAYFTGADEPYEKLKRARMTRAIAPQGR